MYSISYVRKYYKNYDVSKNFDLDKHLSLYKQGSKESGEKLFKQYLKLIIKIVIKYSKKFDNYNDDMLTYGVIGFYKGLNYFDKNKGDNFLSYICCCIARSIQQLCIKDMIHIQNKKKYKFCEFSKEILSENNTEIIDYSYKNNDCLCYNKLLKIFNSLNDKQKNVIYERFYNDLSYDKIAEKYKVSRNTIIELINVIIKIIKKDMLSKTIKEAYDENKITKIIIEMRLKNITYEKIAENLNNLNIKTKYNKKWHKNQIIRLFKRTNLYKPYNCKKNNKLK